jgi:hypothetical protein
VRLPLVGSLLWVPLTSEFQEEFLRRRSDLPSRLYADTPPGVFGDRDKLQHFFGAAFLTYVFESGNAASRVGKFLEWGEDALVVEGALDQRDLRANGQGEAFASCLLRGKAVLPSMFFTTVLPVIREGCMSSELGSFLEER